MNLKALALVSLLCAPVIPARGDYCAPSCATSCASSCNSNSCCDSNNFHSRTFFRPRSLSQNLALEESLTYYNQHMEEQDECNWFDFGVVAPIYYRSTKSKRVGEFFAPGCSNCVTVGQNNSSDVSSAWLNLLAPLDTPFESTLCLKGRREVIGGAFQLRVDFGHWFNDSDECGCWWKNWWVSVFLPVVQVRHNLSLCENGTNNGIIPGYQNVTQALTNPDLCYGKLYTCQKRKSGVDDVAIKVGLDALECECLDFGAYFMIFAPAGHESKAQYLFEPTLGSGGHTGLGFGVTTDTRFWECDENSWAAMLEARYAYFLKHNEHRVFDLCANGEWSRYLQAVCESDVVAPFPATNVLSREVSVTPRSMFELWAAVHHSRCSWNIEVGYDFWYRQSEKVRLSCERSCPESCPCGVVCNGDVGILDIAGCCPRVSASTATISAAIRGPGQPVSDVVFVPLIDADLNLSSGTMPSALSSTLYGAVSYDYCLCDHTGLIGVGGSYEFGHRDAALSQYGVWLKLALDF